MSKKIFIDSFVQLILVRTAEHVGRLMILFIVLAVQALSVKCVKVMNACGESSWTLINFFSSSFIITNFFFFFFSQRRFCCWHSCKLQRTPIRHLRSQCYNLWRSSWNKWRQHIARGTKCLRCCWNYSVSNDSICLFGKNLI